MCRISETSFACSTTVPLKKGRIVARMQRCDIDEGELAEILLGDEALLDIWNASGDELGLKTRSPAAIP